MTSSIEASQIQIKNQRLFRQQLFMAYNYYHTILALALCLLHWFQFESLPLGQEKPETFLTTAIIFFTFSILLTILFRTIGHPKSDVVLFVLFIDINLITLLMYASGGVESGLGSLLVLTVGAGSLLALDIRGILMAALATLAVIMDEYLVSQYSSPSSKSLLQTGTLGIIFFATAYLLQTIAKRLQATEKHAEIQASSIASLEKLNELIVQRMTMGVVVYSDNDRVLVANQAAIDLLELPTTAHEQLQLPNTLKELRTQWINDPSHTNTHTIIKLAKSSQELSITFTPLTEDLHSDTLIFIEDRTHIHQQAQRIKLASLGRLTASIAHEIRNPLSAINHASQLLKESPSLDPADTRLTEIIENHCLRMNKIIENVLQLSRRQPSLAKPLTLKNWLDKFQQDIDASNLREGDFSISVDPLELQVAFDSEQLHQVVTNLCQNALRYSTSEDNPVPKIQINAYINDLNRPCLDVIDNGPGIKESMAAEIFEPFFTTGNTGSGLGLYICRELCESNHARLEYVDIPASGSCFQITFQNTDANRLSHQE